MSRTSSSSVDAPCSTCKVMVTKEDEALEYDLCSEWLHLTCSGTSRKCYELILSCEGLPWICCSCKLSLRSFSSSLRALEADNAALRHQVVELHQEVKLLSGPPHLQSSACPTTSARNSTRSTGPASINSSDINTPLLLQDIIPRSSSLPILTRANHVLSPLSTPTSELMPTGVNSEIYLLKRLKQMTHGLQ